MAMSETPQQNYAQTPRAQDNSAAREQLVDWLRDAHAAEEQSEKMLSKFAGRIENYPALKDQIQRHIEETRGQARRLKSCLDRYGENTSALKDTFGKMMAFAQGMSGAFVDDEIIKGSMAAYTFEHMEIASYRILIAAADITGDMETRNVCEQILEEEIAMATWLEDNLPEITQKYIARAETPGVTAKH
jgi:ferritin-like metal-binding protein YciE